MYVHTMCTCVYACIPLYADVRMRVNAYTCCAYPFEAKRVFVNFHFFFISWQGSSACCHDHNFGATPTKSGLFLHQARESSLLRVLQPLGGFFCTSILRGEMELQPQQSCSRVCPLKSQDDAIQAENRPIWAARVIQPSLRSSTRDEQ